MALAIAVPLAFFLLALIVALILAIIYLNRAVTKRQGPRDAEATMLTQFDSIAHTLDFAASADFHVKASKLKAHIE